MNGPPLGKNEPPMVAPEELEPADVKYAEKTMARSDPMFPIVRLP